MKKIKLLFMGVFLLGATVSAVAQDDNASVDAVVNVIKQNPSAAKSAVSNLIKKNKKNAAVIAKVARAYLDAKDINTASEYAHKAIKVDKKYGEGYIILGDIEVLKDDGGAAAAWYQQAIYFDPKNPNGYFKYANIYRGRSPEEAVEKLNDLRKQRPDIAVDALAARIYYASNKFDKCIEFYDKVDRSKLEDRDISDYAMAAFINQQPQKSLDLTMYGLNKNPRKAGWNRLAFYNNTDLKNYDQALSYADKLFKASDSAKISVLDYTYYGYAYLGAHKYNEAIGMFNKAIENKKEGEQIKNDLYKQLSEAYIGINNYAKSIEVYETYLKSLAEPTASDIAGLGTIYQKLASVKTGAEQTEALKKADDVYKGLAEKFPKIADFTNYMRGIINSQLDPETIQGLAKPYFDALAKSIQTKAEKDDTDKSRLVMAYRYLGYYELQHNNKAACIDYFNKVLEIDPSNEAVKDALSKLKK